MSMPWSMPASGQWGPSADVSQMNMGSYTPEQWAAMQQQNWIQWNQWQQQYAQWQSQYGDKYTEQMQAMGRVPPPPPVAVPPPAPPPPEQPPPPPPPHENNQPLYGQKPQPPPTGVPKPSAPLQQSNAYNTPIAKSGLTQPDPINAEALQKLAEEERLFDIQFQKWEEEIQKWKKDNVNHPDRQAYKEYEEKFETCRAQLLERRQQMKLKRARLVGNVPPVETNQVQPRDIAAYTSQQPNKPGNQGNPSQNYSNQSYQSYNKDQSQFDNSGNQYNLNWSNNKNVNPQDMHESYDDMDTTQDSFPSKDNDSSNFLPASSSSKGIPGLDLVPDPEHGTNQQDVIDITDEQPAGSKNAPLPDYTNISQGINNILGDEKIMNILSMVKNAPRGPLSGVRLPPGGVPPSTGVLPTSGVPPPGAAQAGYNNSFQNNQWNRNQNVPNNQQFGNRQGSNSFNQSGNPNQPPNRMFDNRNNFQQNQQGGFRGNYQDGPQNRNNQFSGPPPNMHRNDQYGNMPPNRNNQFGGPPNVPPRNDQHIGPQNMPPKNDQFGGGPPNRNNQFGGPQNMPPRNDQYGGGLNKNNFGGPSNIPNAPRNDQFSGPNNMPPRNDHYGEPRNVQRNNQYGGPQGMPPRNDQFGNAQNMPPGKDQYGVPQTMPPRNNQYGGPPPNMPTRNDQFEVNTNQINNRGPGPNRPNITSLLDTPIQPPAMNTPEYSNNMNNRAIPEPVKPKWIEEPLFTPSIIVEYEHMPLRLKARDFIEPVHTFDYNHKSKDEDKKIDFEKEVEGLYFSRKRRNSSVEDDFRDKYPRESFSRDPYARDPYPREPYSRDPYPREPYPKDPYSKDSFSRDPKLHPRDIYAKDSRYSRDLYRRESRDVYNRDRDSRDMYNRDRDRDRDSKELWSRDSRDSFPKESREPYSRDVRLPRDSRDGRDSHSRDPYSRDMYDRDRRPRDRDDYHSRSRDDDRRMRVDDRPHLTTREEDRNVDRDREKNRENQDDSNNRHSKEKELTFTQSKESPVSDLSKKSKELPTHVVMIDDLLELPGREMRPEKIVIILRGPPGSGKSYLAKLIRDREAEHGGTVRIMSIDDYFMQETEVEEKDPNTGKMVKKIELKYEYDEKSEETYTNSLKRAFKRSLTDGYFSFIVYDAVNERLKCFSDIWNFARQSGFQVYVCTMELDPQTCFKRNIHNRSLEDIEVICSRFAPTLSHHIQLDPTTLLQNAAIEEVQMEDAIEEVIMEDSQNEVENSFTSKWEKMDDENKLARLDGTSKPLRPSQLSMEDYLQLDDWQPNAAKPGKKSVRWADIEERREQEKMRAIGFVVGQTDWNRMTDPTMGSSALTKTKYIERVRRN